MGSGRFDAGDWDRYASTTTGKSTADMYRTSSAKEVKKKGLLPVKDDGSPMFRESRDSDLNPNSNAIIIGLDLTGSMGILADTIARDGLGKLFKEVYDRKPVPDPHVMFMGIGDVLHDTVPLQISQFEADIRLIEQLTDMWIHHGGGGNAHESYDLPWYFAGMHTSIDCFEKRGRRGFLFTIGDERAPQVSTVAQLKTFLGDDVQSDMTAEASLELAKRMYHVFHLKVRESGTGRSDRHAVDETWDGLLGQHALELTDHTKLSEVIVSAIQVVHGESVDKVTSSWKGDTSVVVHNAIKGLTVRDDGSSVGVARL